MARKKKPEEHENHERWLVSYADFITLLFAFFVVMYAMSSVNEGKFRILSESLIAAFRDAPRSFEPIQVGDPISAPQQERQDVNSDAAIIQAVRLPVRQEIKKGKKNTDGVDGETKDMRRLANDIERALAGLIAKDLIKVRQTKNWVEVEINTNILFASGGSLLQVEAVPILSEVARILKNFDNAVRVEGFTDNLPINTEIFPSNWELSAARAASVVHLFSDEGVTPVRMAAIGYGEHRPAADNGTAEGRARNRRVVILILSKEAEKAYDRGAIDMSESTLPSVDIDLDAPVEPVNADVVIGDKEGVPVTVRKSVMDVEQASKGNPRPADVNKVIDRLGIPDARPAPARTGDGGE